MPKTFKQRSSFNVSSQLGILGGTYIFVTSLMMLTILAPLRMLELGFSALQIGAVAATAAFVSFFGQLPGGACCDRYGKRLLIGLSFVSLSTAGIGMLLGSSLTLFFIIMGLRGLSGSLFWPAAQSYASLIDPPRASVILGRQTGSMAAATITGALLAGYIAAFYGFKPAFALAAVLSAVGMFFSLLIPELKQAEVTLPEPFTIVFKSALHLLTVNRSLQLATFCAFIAAIPIALNGSFYPVYFVSLGYDERVVGVLSALLNLAILLAGLAFGFLDRRFRSNRLFLLSLLGMTLSMLLLSLDADFWLLVLSMVLQGFALGLVLVLRLSLASVCTAARERGSAIGVVEMGFCAALFILPLVYGSSLERVGFATAFLYLGFFLFAAALFSIISFHRLRGKNLQPAAHLSEKEKMKEKYENRC
ncbi:MAG: MFS transporter [Bacillota bacterium]